MQGNEPLRRGLLGEVKEEEMSDLTRDVVPHRPHTLPVARLNGKTPQLAPQAAF